MKTSVIISTYNSPVWLQKVLWGYFSQNRTDFEIVIADDGSTEETGKLISTMAAECPVPLTHVWQPDDGFQKCRILNKAIAVAHGERILVTDGDCVPRRDFVDVHTRFAQPGRFLTGGYFKLPIEVSRTLTRDSIVQQKAFDAGWLMQHGLPFTSKLLKLVVGNPIDGLLNAITPAKPSWNGHSSSCLRSDVIKVNGFNEDMQYGGMDVEFGLRLRYNGIMPQHVRYSAITIHLYHGHGYVTPEMLQRSHDVKENTRDKRLRWADRGLDQWLGSEGKATLGKSDRLIRH